MTQSQFIVFGDQAVPYDSDLHKLLSKKDSHILAVFLLESYHALKTEISRLPRSERAQFPSCPTLAEFLVAYKSSQLRTCALDSALVCLHQLASFISYASETLNEYPSPSSSCLIGSCIGLVAAAAVSCSSNIIELISNGPEFVVLAFRLGLLVQTKTKSLTANSQKSDSYSVVVAGIDEKSASLLVDEYCLSQGLTVSSRIYVSAIGNDNITVSGFPAHLQGFCSQNSNLKTVKVSVSGLFHSPQLYTAADTEKLLQSVNAATKTKIAHLSVLSNATGNKIPATTSSELLAVAFEEILSKPLRWDLISRNAHASLSQPVVPKVHILPFASGSVQSLCTALSRSGTSSVTIVDTTTREQPESKRSKIAIIGFSGRYPEADNNEEFWNLLLAGLDVHKDIPKNRFDPWLYYDPTGKKKNTSGVTKGNFLKNPALFDARFFGLSPREAEQADPAQRLAMMTAYEAMEMAGFVPDTTSSTQRDRVGVFYGTASDDYRECNSAQNVDTYFVPGGSRAFLPARINYQWRFSGPSFDVDTACSSSLAAIHIACNCLWRGDCDTAIAGGTNVLTNPDNWAGLDRAHFLSRTGNCNTFDDGADGYCRAESVGTVILKRLEDAELDGDPIFGTILGAYTNHSAEAVSMTRPHSGAQRAIFSKILTGASVENNEVSYVEMHGTGTQHGDACEMDSVLSVFAPGGSQRSQSLYLGSTKANIGHAESASGVSSLIKVLLMMEKGLIPPHVGIKTRINRNFPTDLTQRNVHIAFQPTSWTRPLDKPQGRRAFVNNFGAAGGNSSVLLEDAPLLTETVEDPRPLHMVAVSAKSSDALKRNIRALREFIDANPGLSVSSLSYTTTARRIHYAFHTIVSGSNIHDIRGALQLEESKEGWKSTATATSDIGFCFTGQGAQYLGMGQRLLQIPQFRAIIANLEDILRVQGFMSVLPVIDGSLTSPIEDLSPVTLQLSIVCLQMALGKFWKCLGISPHLVVGHSLGEYAALNISGVLSDADTIYLVGTRAKLLEQHCSIGTHSMLAIKTTHTKLSPLITSHQGLEIACINGPEEVVVAGPNNAIETFASVLGQLSIKSTQLRVQFAFHSAQVEPMLEPYQRSCRSIQFKDPVVPMLSPLLGKTITTASEFGSPAVYLSRHCRETVNFQEAVSHSSDKTPWLEVGPHPICTGMIKSILGPAATAFPSLRRNEDEWKTLVSTITSLYQIGVTLDWNEYHRGFKQSLRVLRLPAYQWDLKEYWIPYMHDWCLTKGNPPGQILPAQSTPVEETVKQIFTSSVQTIVAETQLGDEASITARSDIKYPHLLAVIKGHRINSRPLCPSSVYADMALTLFTRLLDRSSLPDKSLYGVEVSGMVVDKTLLLDDQPSQLIELKASARWSNRSATFSLSSISKDGKVTANHARCTATFTKKSQWVAEWKRRGFLVKSMIQSLQNSVRDDLESSVHVLKPGMFYKLFSSIVEYDNNFKGVRDVLMSSENLECAARVKFNTSAGESDRWLLSPHWIESLGQITGFSLNGNDTLDTENYVFINHGWENMKFIKTPSPEETYQTYIRMQPIGDGSYSGDLYILDSDDEVIGTYEGVTFNTLSRKLFDRILPKPTSSTSNPDTVLQAVAPATSATTRQAIGSDPGVPIASAMLQPVAVSPEATDLGQGIAARVRILISEEVGVSISELKDDDDFVSIGVDSLLALTMSDRIREDFGTTIDSTIFLTSMTVRDLIQRISGVSTPSSSEDSAPQTPQSLDVSHNMPNAVNVAPLSGLSSPWTSISEDFGDSTPKTQHEYNLCPIAVKSTITVPPATSVLLQGNPRNAEKTVWLIPDGSGLATSYLLLPDIDIESVAVYGLNSPFAKHTENMSHCTFAQLTEAYLTEIRRRQPCGPYILGGWSAGGICAYDIAQHLVIAGEIIERLLLIDSPNPIRLQKLPERLYGDFDRKGVFGSAPGRKPPAWLLSHFKGFVDILHSYEPRAFVGASPLKTWVIWAEEGVADDGSIEILPGDPPNLRWLLRNRSAADLGTNGWEQLVGRENITIEVLPGANHFSMLKEPAADIVGSFIARAITLV